MAATMGKDGFISLDGTTVLATFIDTWNLNPSIDTAEVSAFGDGFKSFVSTLKSWSVTASGTLDRSDSQQSGLLTDFESTASSTAKAIRMYDSTSYWSGNAFVTAAPVNSQVGDKVTVSYTLQGTGALSYITT